MWIKNNLEVLPLVINIGITIAYIVKADEPGKIMYWLGAAILTVGLLWMKG